MSNSQEKLLGFQRNRKHVLKQEGKKLVEHRPRNDKENKRSNA